MRIAGHEFAVKHPDKLMYPADGITKQQVVDYYVRIAPYVLPYTRQRPLVMVRYPEGIGAEGFYQKQRSDYFPSWMTTVTIPLIQGGMDEMVVADSAAALAYLSSQTALVFHVWTATVDKLHRPDCVVFDLDPSDNDFRKVIATAQLLRPYIQTVYRCDAQVVTTGAHGLHLIISIPPTRDFELVRAEAHAIALDVARAQPQLATVDVRKDKRGDRVYIDIARNAYGQTHVVPYSLRALPGAPVATPVAWSELTGKLTPQTYNLSNIFDRLATVEKP